MPTEKPLLINPLLERLRSGGLGLTLMLKQARTIEIALAARATGYDALLCDLQHTTMSVEQAAQIAVAALNVGVTPLARVPHGDYGMALRLLDGGMQGIVFPEVVTAAEAREAVLAAKYAPMGARGANAGTPHFGFRSIPAAEGRKLMNDTTLVIVMLESMAALENVDAIAATPGVDIVHIGCGDLSADLGISGQLDHPDILKQIERAAAATRKHGKFCGVGGLSGNDTGPLKKVLALGPRYITGANEWSLMMGALQERSKWFRESSPD